ncbi:hypothetical protein UFOVP1419_17 [uncultured Caudovirales phage]|uniref:DUF3789 domain-containing protein n=1 Tax=uncultured Caudovirales phage TaxID=2100421 RepID=A0A6J5SDT8_9CAUD|nr:hypothetical protein UFOVP1419_17 [uncultured Caudovirales phage]
MAPVWVAFWIGCFIGGMCGVVMMALCVAARSGDDLLMQCHCDHVEPGRVCRECLAPGVEA